MASGLRKRTQAAVDGFRTGNPGCDLAVLIDPETGLVLCQSSGTPVSQERLDLVAAEGRQVLNSETVTGCSDIVSDGTMISVMELGKASVTVTVQNIPSDDVALVCRFSDLLDQVCLLSASAEALAIVSDREPVSR